MDPYLGEIRMTGFNFAPVGWAICDGTVLQIADNPALYALIGAAYGGDGQTTFAVPDLRGRVPLRAGGSYALGVSGGSDSVALDVNTMPPHSHLAVVVETPGSVSKPEPGILLAKEYCSSMKSDGAPVVYTYGPPSGAQTPLAASTIMAAGTGQTHENRQPYLAINFIIATDGMYPGG